MNKILKKRSYFLLAAAVLPPVLIGLPPTTGDADNESGSSQSFHERGLKRPSQGSSLQLTCAVDYRETSRMETRMSGIGSRRRRRLRCMFRPFTNELNNFN